jgi:hypothetical protein
MSIEQTDTYTTVAKKQYLWNCFWMSIEQIIDARGAKIF